MCAKVEVTEIILPKIYRFCQSQSRCFSAPFYDANMLPNVEFDKTAFIKFKISNNLKQNIDETYSKQPKTNSYQPMDYRYLMKKSANQKS